MPISGSGALDIARGSTLQIGGAVSVAKLSFNTGTDETLYVAKPSALSSTISGFASGDTIDLKGVTATTLTFIAGTPTLYDGATAVDTLTFTGPEMQADFVLKGDGQGGTDILYGGGMRDEPTLWRPSGELSPPGLALLLYHDHDMAWR